MCGITGFVNFKGHDRESVSPQIKRMADTLNHRGPDAEGFFVDDHAALGHRRLNIIAISSGSQPMGNDDDTMQIVFNGEIYNFPELKKELVKRGYSFRTESDTEVILNAYTEWGELCVEKLNGMFAFAIWDSNAKKLFLARDRVGKKPLYYHWDGETFSFGSEIKALLAGGFSHKNLNPRALDCYFSFGYIPVPFSIYDDISKLPAAHTLTVTEEGIRQKRYWKLDYTAPHLVKTMDEAAEELEQLLREAVRCRLMSEVPLGAFLSSGLDSSLVVSFMAEIMDKPVLTNTIGFGDPRFSELPASRQIAHHLNTDHREFIVQPDASNTIKEMAAFFDEPLADSSALPTWHVCKMARQNVTVALSGDGGDEAFGGYTFRYIPHLMESTVKSAIPTALRSSFLSIIGSIYPASSKLPKYLRLKTIFENLSVSDAEAFYQDLVFLRPDTRASLYSRAFLEELKGFTPMEMVLPLYNGSPAPDAVAKAQHTDMQFYMTDDVLVKADRMSMAHSLEVRNPLLDHRILEFAATLPLELKLNKNRGKVLLRHLASRRLPQSIQNLPKMGFSIPAAQWLRQELKDQAHGTIFNSPLIKSRLNKKSLERIWHQHQKGHRDHSVFLWGLMMLGLWENLKQ
ncbi:MAG: asparagine synthase (glutamine-hydrolyzing) [Desulfobacterium sp.]|nr:asparagine synthase (glutamine-hydrolyzing) [Desulfobacterium sp.]